MPRHWWSTRHRRRTRVTSSHATALAEYPATPPPGRACEAAQGRHCRTKAEPPQVSAARARGACAHAAALEGRTAAGTLAPRRPTHARGRACAMSLEATPCSTNLKADVCKYCRCSRRVPPRSGYETSGPSAACVADCVHNVQTNATAQSAPKLDRSLSTAQGEDLQHNGLQVAGRTLTPFSSRTSGQRVRRHVGQPAPKISTVSGRRSPD